MQQRHGRFPFLEEGWGKINPGNNGDFFSLKLNDALSYEILYLHTEETDIRDKDKKRIAATMCARLYGI